MIAHPRTRSIRNSPSCRLQSRELPYEGPLASTLLAANGLFWHPMGEPPTLAFSETFEIY